MVAIVRNVIKVVSVGLLDRGRRSFCRCGWSVWFGATPKCPIGICATIPLPAYQSGTLQYARHAGRSSKKWPRNRKKVRDEWIGAHPFGRFVYLYDINLPMRSVLSVGRSITNIFVPLFGSHSPEWNPSAKSTRSTKHFTSLLILEFRVSSSILLLPRVINHSQNHNFSLVFPSFF